MKTQADWDAFFQRAERTCCIQNANPAPYLGSRNIFQDDKAMILEAARKFGFRIMHSGKLPKVVSFIRETKNPADVLPTG